MAPEEKGIFVFDKITRKLNIQSIVNTAAIKNYYRRLQEQGYSETEGRAKNVIDKWIRNPYGFEKQDINVIAEFIAMSHARVPRSIMIARKLIKFAREKICEECKEKSKDKGLIEKSYAVFYKRTGNTNNVSLDEYSRYMTSYMQGRKKCNEVENKILDDIIKSDSIGTEIFLLGYLLRSHWSFLIAEHNDYFLTCDAPVNIFALTENGSVIVWGGLHEQEVEISFPISPKICLIVTANQKFKERFYDRELVTEINLRTFRVAERYVFSTYKFDDLAKILHENSYAYANHEINSITIKDEIKNGLKISENSSQ